MSSDTEQKFDRDPEPTAKEVLALHKEDPKTDSEREYFKYLQRFICGLD